MSKKDDHIESALHQHPETNDFDRVRLMPNALPECALESVDPSIKFLGHTVDWPIYINAMTGGTKRAKAINAALSVLAAHFNIPMATGSVSIALKDSDVADSFTTIRAHNPRGVILANLGAEHSLQNARAAINLVRADALQIHLNAMQELIMPGGDEDFHGWIDSIETIHSSIDVPLVIKEVGFGIDPASFKRLAEIGVDAVDVAGRGGTDFASIENARRTKPLMLQDAHGLSTVEALLEVPKTYANSVFASGGIRNPYDVIKALALGADAVGLSGWFLRVVENNTLEDAKQRVGEFLDELKRLMCAFGACDVAGIRTIEKIYDPTLYAYIQQRDIKKA